MAGCLVDTSEVVGPHPELRVEDDLGVDVKVGERLLEILPGSLESDGLARQGLHVLALADMGGRTSDKKDVRRVDDVAASELRGSLAGRDLRLVGVVVEDVSELLLVHPAQGTGDLLGKSVGDTVGVSDSFALDDLDVLHRYGDLVQSLDVDVLSHLVNL